MSLNQNNRRLAFAAVIALLVLTAIFLLLEKTPLVIAAYCFGQVGVAELAVTLLLLSGANKGNYITRAAFPLVAWNYFGAELGLSAVAVLLEYFGVWVMPVGWFCLLHILLLAFFAWKMLAMDAGQETIEEVGREVKARTLDWKMLRADAEALLGETPEAFKKPVSEVRDAVRYADPMSDPALGEQDAAIAAGLHGLAKQVKTGDADAVRKLCDELLRRIKDRNTRAKMLK